uniref:Uncharacterized protein n=1 Tax=Sphaerodactylus townsendi TaxID=933632 RepID=A0ACB8F8N8_9SAUR
MVQMDLDEEQQHLQDTQAAEGLLLMEVPHGTEATGTVLDSAVKSGMGPVAEVETESEEGSSSTGHDSPYSATPSGDGTLVTDVCRPTKA